MGAPAEADKSVKIQLPYNEGKRIEDFLELQREQLGAGGYGVVCEGKDKHTGSSYAVKLIPKKAGIDREKLDKEIRIMTKLDHPNVVKLFQTFQDSRYVYLVMEMCQGGELFDRIIQEKHFTEKDAATVMQQVFRGIHYTHNVDIVHRDLKPENLMLLNKGPIKGNIVKVIDYGIAAEWKGDLLVTKNGTLDYMGPELVQLLTQKSQGYGKEVDVWACGVILYVLLSGNLPFKGHNDAETLKKITEGKMSWKGFDRYKISKEARDLIEKLLTVKKNKRATMQEALNHPWTKHTAPSATSVALSEVVSNLENFSRANKLKKTALHMVARQMDDRKTEMLRTVFTQIDANGDGTITLQELNDGLASAGVGDAAALRDLAKKLDTDHSGTIDYTEFLAATLDKSQASQEAACWAAFRVFDKNDDQKISVEELKAVLQSRDMQRQVGKQQIQDIMAEVDTNGDGEIDFDEFMAMMRK
jgi:calcium-dependent protein kinase